MEERHTDIRVERRAAQHVRQRTPASHRHPAEQRPRRPQPAPPPARRRTADAHAAARPRRRRRKRSNPLGFAAALILVVALGGMIVWLLRGGRSVEPAEVPQSIAAEPVQTVRSGPPYTIVIDAGHGGIDLGTDSGIVTEVEMVEATTDALVALLNSDANFTPIRTRENGEGMSIADRAAVANDNSAALFLSIHGNYDETLTASGFECYAQTPGRSTHDASVQFANAIVSAMRDAGAEIRGQSGVRYAYYEDNGDGTYDKVIAEASDETVRSEVTFGVLEKNERPAVLVEQCFLSDQEDCAAWATPEGCEKAARAYYEAICSFFGLDPAALV